MNRIKNILNWLLNLFRKEESIQQPIQVQKIKNKTKKFDIKVEKYKFHQHLDYLWMNRKISRTKLYNLMSQYSGLNFHVSNLNNENDFNKAYRALNIIKYKIEHDEIISDSDYFNNPIVMKAVGKRIKKKQKKFK